MASHARQRPPMWFWIVAAIVTLWGVMGIFAFYSDATMREATLAGMSEYDRGLYRARPGWFIWVYGIATWGGLLGGIALLLRRRLAWPLFLASLIAVIVQFGWVFGATDLIAVKGAAATVPFPLFITAVAVFQLWFAGFAARRGWVV